MHLNTFTGVSTFGAVQNAGLLRPNAGMGENRSSKRAFNRSYLRVKTLVLVLPTSCCAAAVALTVQTPNPFSVLFLRGGSALWVFCVCVGTFWQCVRGAEPEHASHIPFRGLVSEGCGSALGVLC